MDLHATLFWEPMMKHSDFELTDDELKRINEIIQRQIVPGEQNDGVVIRFMYWVTGRLIQVSHSGAEFEDVDT